MRPELTVKNKILRFFIQSIGQVALIVISLLLTFSIDNWKDHKNNMDTAKVFIQDIKNDLIRDTSVFASELRKIDIIVKYKRYLLERDSLKKWPTNDIQSILWSGYHNLKINNSSYVRMTESGVLSLPEYSELFKKFSSYYGFYKPYIDGRNDWERGLYDKEFAYFSYQNQFEINLNDSTEVIQLEPERRKNLLKILQSPEGRNIIKANINRENAMNKTYQGVKMMADKLLFKIDSISRKVN